MIVQTKENFFKIRTEAAIKESSKVERLDELNECMINVVPILHPLEEVAESLTPFKSSYQATI